MQNGGEPGKHTIAVLVENKFGVLSRVAGLFSARGYNIESLSVGETLDPTVSRMTIVVHGDEFVIEQVTKQLHKLIDVIKVSDLTEDDHVERELMLIRVNAEPQHRAEIMRTADIFRAKIVDVTPQSFTIEATRASGQEVVVGLYKGSKSWGKAEKDGLKVAPVADAAKLGDVVMILLPDQTQRQVFEESIKGGLGRGKMLMFAHGFNIHFNQVVPPPDVDVTMIAPKAPGHVMRDLFTQGPRVVSEETKVEMKKILSEIQSGQFAREWVLENQANRAQFLAMRKRDADHKIEEVGQRLRAMMSWIKPPRM